MKIDPNASAFTLPGIEGQPCEPGLAIRAHFAAMAMQGFAASQHTWMEEPGRPSMSLMPPDQAAAWAVSYADALIEALNK